jgi:hypothetical protein
MVGFLTAVVIFAVLELLLGPALEDMANDAVEALGEWRRDIPRRERHRRRKNGSLGPRDTAWP